MTNGWSTKLASDCPRVIIFFIVHESLGRMFMIKTHDSMKSKFIYVIINNFTDNFIIAFLLEQMNHEFQNLLQQNKKQYSERMTENVWWLYLSMPL